MNLLIFWLTYFTKLPLSANHVSSLVLLVFIESRTFLLLSVTPLITRQICIIVGGTLGTLRNHLCNLCLCTGALFWEEWKVWHFDPSLWMFRWPSLTWEEWTMAVITHVASRHFTLDLRLLKFSSRESSAPIHGQAAKCRSEKRPHKIMMSNFCPV